MLSAAMEKFWKEVVVRVKEEVNKARACLLGGYAQCSIEVGGQVWRRALQQDCVSSCSSQALDRPETSSKFAEIRDGKSRHERLHALCENGGNRI